MLAIFIGTLASISAIFLAYKTMPKFRFWFFDIWADLPLIGTVARRSRMAQPSTELANARLDELFHAYLLHIPRPITEGRFDQIRKYLFLAGDSRSKPTPSIAWALLFGLICAESYAFSFLLGVSLAGDMSQDRADLVAVGIAFILGMVLLILAHNCGHSLRRTNELRSAKRGVIDSGSPLPAGERPLAALQQNVSLEADQDCDEAVHVRDDEQRKVNRVAKDSSDNGGYALAVLFIIAILLITIGQFQLRSDFAKELGLSTGSGPQWANALFALIFLLTQGHNDYNDYRLERDPMISRADESLTSLYSAMKGRYPNNIKPEQINFLQRLDREDRQGKTTGVPDSPVPTEIENQSDNVVAIEPNKAG
jgi:hypothetical protein